MLQPLDLLRTDGDARHKRRYVGGILMSSVAVAPSPHQYAEVLRQAEQNFMAGIKAFDTEIQVVQKYTDDLVAAIESLKQKPVADVEAVVLPILRTYAEQYHNQGHYSGINSLRYKDMLDRYLAPLETAQTKCASFTLNSPQELEQFSLLGFSQLTVKEMEQKEAALAKSIEQLKHNIQQRRKELQTLATKVDQFVTQLGTTFCTIESAKGEGFSLNTLVSLVSTTRSYLATALQTHHPLKLAPVAIAAPTASTSSSPSSSSVAAITASASATASTTSSASSTISSSSATTTVPAIAPTKVAATAPALVTTASSASSSSSSSCSVTQSNQKTNAATGSPLTGAAGQSKKKKKNG